MSVVSLITSYTTFLSVCHSNLPDQKVHMIVESLEFNVCMVHLVIVDLPLEKRRTAFHWHEDFVETCLQNYSIVMHSPIGCTYYKVHQLGFQTIWNLKLFLAFRGKWNY